MESFIANHNNGGGDDDATASAVTFNDMFSGVSLLSLLTASNFNYPLPPPPLLTSSGLPPLPPSIGFDHPGPPLPDLLSLESLHPPLPRAGYKRPRAAPSLQPRVPQGSALARQRRQRLSEKTRCLQRVLPWDKKMDMATMLEETYKYVKFLQAQLRALSAMPDTDVTTATATAAASHAPLSEAFGGLGRLSRSQLLQVLVNSPVAQTTLSSKGCCIFSVEQLGLIQMKRIRTSSNFLIPNPFSSF